MSSLLFDAAAQTAPRGSASDNYDPFLSPNNYRRFQETSSSTASAVNPPPPLPHAPPPPPPCSVEAALSRASAQEQPAAAGQGQQHGRQGGFGGGGGGVGHQDGGGHQVKDASRTSLQNSAPTIVIEEDAIGNLVRPAIVDGGGTSQPFAPISPPLSSAAVEAGAMTGALDDFFLQHRHQYYQS